MNAERPTGAQVDDALAYADSTRVRDKHVVYLAAEVRALRVEVRHYRLRGDGWFAAVGAQEDELVRLRARVAELEEDQ